MWSCKLALLAMCGVLGGGSGGGGGGGRGGSFAWVFWLDVSQDARIISKIFHCKLPIANIVLFRI